MKRRNTPYQRIACNKPEHKKLEGYVYYLERDLRQATALLAAANTKLLKLSDRPVNDDLKIELKKKDEIIETLKQTLREERNKLCICTQKD